MDHKHWWKRTVNVEVEGFFCAASHIVSHTGIATNVRHLSSQHLLNVEVEKKAQNCRIYQDFFIIILHYQEKKIIKIISNAKIQISISIGYKLNIP